MNESTDKHWQALPGPAAIPVREDGEPVFAEPWEARIFGMVVSACDQGKFAWKDFQQLLIEEIRDSENLGVPRAYYLNWAIAAEKIFASIGALAPDDVDQRVDELRPGDKTVRLE